MKTINISLPVDTPYMTVEGIVYHNDAGSMTPESYAQWLPNNWQNAFAHIYMDRFTTLYTHPLNKKGWHTGNTYGNGHLIGIEIVQSLSASSADFLANEQAAFKLGAQLLKERGLVPSANTIKLHKELSATSCPARSIQLHGVDIATLNYFIEQTKKYYYGSEEIKPVDPKKLVKYWVGWNVGKDFTKVQEYRVNMNKALKIDYLDVFYYKDGSNDWHIGVTNLDHNGLENYRLRLMKAYGLNASQMEGQSFDVDSWIFGYKDISIEQLQNIRVRWTRQLGIDESRLSQRQANGKHSIFVGGNSFREIQHWMVGQNQANADMNISDKRHYELEK